MECVNIYIYRERERWVQVTPGVTLRSYTFFKPLDLSRSNGKKKSLINANILIRISLIIPHLLYFISISKSKKNVIFDSLSLSTFLSLSLSPPPLLINCRQKKGKKKKTVEHYIRGL